MSDRQTFVLVSPRVRANALRAVREVPDGYVVTVRPKTRSLDQNAHFHALCGDLEASSVEWFGRRRSADEWKVLLISAHAMATGEGSDVIPGIEGELVNIRESSAKMTVARASSLIEYTLAFCSSNGVELAETRRAGFDAKVAA